MTSIGHLTDAGIVEARAGVVRLRRRSELDGEWQAEGVGGSIWTLVQHLIRLQEVSGEQAAADLLARAGAVGVAARDLAYRLYVTCERRGWASDALAFNGLVVAWPEISRLASLRERAAVQETML